MSNVNKEAMSDARLEMEAEAKMGERGEPACAVGEKEGIVGTSSFFLVVGVGRARRHDCDFCPGPRRNLARNFGLFSRCWPKRS